MSRMESVPSGGLCCKEETGLLPDTEHLIYQRPKRGRQNCIAYSRWGLTELLKSVSITPLLLNKVSLNEFQHC